MKYKFTKEHRKNLSLAHKGQSSPFKGKKQPEERKKRISKAVKKRWIEGIYNNRPNLSHKGKDNPSWKGGITKRCLNTRKYKKWRMEIFLRDNFTCQFCNIRGGYLEAHHIKEWKDYPKLRFSINNGVTLCKNCHNLTKKGGRRNATK